MKKGFCWNTYVLHLSIRLSIRQANQQSSLQSIRHLIGYFVENT